MEKVIEINDLHGYAHARIQQHAWARGQQFHERDIHDLAKPLVGHRSCPPVSSTCNRLNILFLLHSAFNEPLKEQNFLIECRKNSRFMWPLQNFPLKLFGRHSLNNNGDEEWGDHSSWRKASAHWSMTLTSWPVKQGVPVSQRCDIINSQSSVVNMTVTSQSISHSLILAMFSTRWFENDKPESFSYIKVVVLTTSLLKAHTCTSTILSECSIQHGHLISSCKLTVSVLCYLRTHLRTIY